MAIKSVRPTSPGRRFQTYPTREDITRKRPERGLLRPLKSSGGRNALGRMTVRHRGGGHKRLYRIIDFKRDKDGIPASVAGIEYDPNRSANIALLQYADGEKRYILAPLGLKVGDKVVSGQGAEIRTGNALALRDIPLGTPIHNVELNTGHGGQLVRGAGGYAQVMAKEGDMVTLRLRSTEVRMVPGVCWATIGEVGNAEHELASLGKAGKTRWLGRRPKVRGVAMNPVDHPLGGGEGKASGGRPPVSPWGRPEGRKTRKRKKHSSKMILRGRKRGKATK